MKKKKRNYKMSILSYLLCICILCSSWYYNAYAEVVLTVENVSIGERLQDNEAYISEARLLEDSRTESEYAIRTGTSPWDMQEEAGIPGNDYTDLDNIVRSFDVISYTAYFKSKMRPDSLYKAYRTGTLYFEFILPVSSDKARFETGSMGWLSAKKDVQYEIIEGTYQNQPCQFLRGSYLWEPNEDNPAAIGESYQELSMVIRVLGMHNQEKIAPFFTFWLEGNEEQDYKTIKTPEITVTAGPRYNVQLKTCDERTSYVGYFPFDTGNERAANKTAGTLYGRANTIGVTLQIVGKTKQHGLRGCEIPVGDIHLNIDIDSIYHGTDGTTTDVMNQYTPLLWSLSGNEKDYPQEDGREIAGTYKFAANGAPLNTGNTYYGCFQGGQWNGTQNGNTIDLTISEYQINPDHFPYADSNSMESVYTYYDPKTCLNFWDIQEACFSAGELWIVQPFYDSDGTFIEDELGTGSFQITLKDAGLAMTSISGIPLETVSDNENQMITVDDTISFPMNLEQPGYIDQSITYQKYQTVTWGTSLTDGCWDNGKDWIMSGGTLNIQEIFKHNTAEGMCTGVAYDDLIKFDDQFFVLEGVCKGSNAGLEQMNDQFLFGAKPDKSGWNHQGKEPQEDGYDDEMKQATADDLIFFSSLEELIDQGYQCVAVLWEARGLASSQSTNCYIALQGHVAASAKSGHVYMVTHSGKGWNKTDVQSMAAAYCGKTAELLTDADYITFAQSTAFPSRRDRMDPLSYDDDYPTAFWNNDSSHDSGLVTYLKSIYDENGYVDGLAGRKYGDSCLVVDYIESITKNTIQQTSEGEKRSYDMDSDQRVVDYILKPSVSRISGESITEGSTYTTDLYVEDILPKGLSYIEGSSYWGGTYIQSKEGYQGLIEGGIPIEPEVENQTDGTTILRWTLEQVDITEQEVTNFQPIYYSCQIGVRGNEEVDVKNNQQLNNQVKIWSKDQTKREFSMENGNMAEMSILISKNNAISLSKTADKPVIGPGETMGFVLNIGNNSQNPMNIIALDSLPYDGDQYGSSFSGVCEVEELTVETIALCDNLTLYYTEEESERGKDSSEYHQSDFSDTFIWNELDLQSDGTVILPDNFEPVAIAAVGILPGTKTLKLHITLCVPDAEDGDRIINGLTNSDLECDAEVSVVFDLDEVATDSNASPEPDEKATPSNAAPASDEKATPSNAAPAPGEKATPSNATPASDEKATPSNAAPASDEKATPSNAAPASDEKATPSNADTLPVYDRPTEGDSSFWWTDSDIASDQEETPSDIKSYIRIDGTLPKTGEGAFAYLWEFMTADLGCILYLLLKKIKKRP